MPTPEEYLHGFGLHDSVDHLRRQGSSSSGDNSACTTPTFKNVGGVDLNVNNVFSFIVGLAFGLQVDHSIAGACVYSSIALLEYLDVYIYALQLAFGGNYGSLFTAIVYNYVHLIANVVGFYEYCSLSYFLDVLSMFVGLDVVSLADYLVRTGFSSAKTVPGVISTMTQYLTGTCADYYDAGIEAAFLITIFANLVVNS